MPGEAVWDIPDHWLEPRPMPVMHSGLLISMPNTSSPPRVNTFNPNPFTRRRYHLAEDRSPEPDSEG